MNYTKVWYEQKFMGKKLTDSYIKYAELTEAEKQQTERDLMTDPHVTRVWFETVDEESI